MRMGRNSTGAITVNSCLQFSVKEFTKIIKEQSFNLPFTLAWQNGASISANLKQAAAAYTLEIQYEKNEEGEKIPIKYDVWIIGKPSNLGKGTIYYFICPFKGTRCRTLYMGYGSRYFKSRKAYRHRIYYPSQLSSYLDKHNDTYWRLENGLEKLYKKHRKSHYKEK